MPFGMLPLLCIHYLYNISPFYSNGIKKCDQKWTETAVKIISNSHLDVLEEHNMIIDT